MARRIAIRAVIIVALAMAGWILFLIGTHEEYDWRMRNGFRPGVGCTDGDGIWWHSRPPNEMSNGGVACYESDKPKHPWWMGTYR